MHRNGDTVVKGVVVEDVDAEEQEDVDGPAPQRHLVRGEVERRPGTVPLCDVARDGDEEELDKCQESACGCWVRKVRARKVPTKDAPLPDS